MANDWDNDSNPPPPGDGPTLGNGVNKPPETPAHEPPLAEMPIAEAPTAETVKPVEGATAAGGFAGFKARAGEVLRGAWSRTRESAGPMASKVGAKMQQWQLREKLQRVLPKNMAEKMPRSFEPAVLAEWATTTAQALGKSGSAAYLTAATIVLSTWFLADLTGLLLENFIPEPPVPRLARGGGFTGRRTRGLDEYGVVFARNLFSSAGVIPGEEGPRTSEPVEPLGGPPVRTSLPFNLIGTIILQDELRSLATIEDKSASMVYPVRVDDEIPQKARIVAIEANKVIFVNTQNNRKEFVDLPEDVQVQNPKIVPKSTVKAPTKGGVEKVSPTQFNVSRSEVDKALTDLNQVLTQARAVPNFENGMPAGYKLFQIVPGSIYDKLGLQNGDTLCGLNGQAINDPGKAFELLGELKTASNLALCVKRDGKQNNFQYEIR